MGRNFFFQALSGGRVDKASGIIHGVSLISEGPALGHDLLVDGVTVAQIAAACQAFSNGVKVKLEHSGGVSDIVGTVKNIRQDGAKLLGDLHLLENAPLRAYVLELAEKAPDTFGLSVNFHGTAEGVFARCSRIRSVDLVADPAANPDGLFDEKFDSPAPNMADEPKAEAPGAASEKDAGAGTDKMDQLEARIAALEDVIRKALEEEKTEEKTEEGAAKAKPSDEKTEMSALSAQITALTEVVKSLASQKAASVSFSEKQGQGKEMTFAEKVDEKKAAGKSAQQAFSEAMKEFPELHLKSLQAFVKLS